MWGKWRKDKETAKLIVQLGITAIDSIKLDRGRYIRAQ